MSYNASGLVELAITGDDASLTVLLSGVEPELRRRLTRRIPRLLQGAIDVDDVLQEVYADVFRSIRSFVPRSGDAFERWLSTIALRRLRTMLRWHRARKRGGDLALARTTGSAEHSTITLLALIEAGDGTPSGQVARLEDLEAVRVALDRLPDDYRQVVQLVYLEGLGVVQAARRLGRTDAAVHNICHKAKEKLRSMLV